MHDLSVLLTFTGGLAGALLLGYAAHRLRLSPIVGYLLAGVLVGPFTPGFVADRTVAEQFAEIGVILLLFGVGLRFHLKELVAVWRVAVPGALIQSTLSTAMVAALLRLTGWSWSSGLIVGMAISVASTVVMALVLAERHHLHGPIGHIAIGWTVVEDLLTVLLLLALPILVAAPGEGDGRMGAVLALAGAKVVGLGGVVWLLGRWGIPWAMERIARTRAGELFTLAVLALALGIAVGSARIFGVSMALGAFLAGLAVGRSEFSARAAGEVVPMRDAFAVLFFVSVGMLFDPGSVLRDPAVIAIVFLAVVAGKPLAAALTVRLLGRPRALAVPVGAALAQIGEFSFILGAVARQLGLLGDSGWNALVAASILSIALNPTLYRLAVRLAKVTPRDPGAAAAGGADVEADRCVLVGYGPIGRIVHRLLADRDHSVVVVDLNLDTVRELRAAGVAAIYGDAAHPAVLREAGLPGAGQLILSADLPDAAAVIAQARRLNPGLRICARCAHVRDAAALRRAGADFVAAGEAEVGVALAEEAAAADPADAAAARWRETIRRELYESAHKEGDPGPGRR